MLPISLRVRMFSVRIDPVDQFSVLQIDGRSKPCAKALSDRSPAGEKVLI